MGQVAAAADDDLDALRRRVVEPRRRQVEEGGAAGGEDDRAWREELLRRAQACDLHEVVEEGGDLGVLLGRRSRGEQAFEAFDAAERQVRRGGLNGARHRQGVVARAAAGAAAGDAAFEQHLQRAADAGGRHDLGETADAGEQIDQAVEIEGGVAAQLVGDGRDLLAADELIGEHHATDAEAAGDHHLPDAGDGDAPGAVGQLLGEQLRRHGGLAVGRDPGVGQFEEAPHPAAVVIERRALDHGDRQRQVALQQVPAALADLAEAAWEPRPAAGP